jgi:putative polyhydroxyalkanoate system protein
MPRFELEIPHSLPPADVKTRLDGATVKLESKYKATCAWTNDRELKVTRMGLDARVIIEDARVHVEMTLGLLLIPMAAAIKAGLARELTALLAT